MANFHISNVRIQLKHDTAANWATNSGLIPLSGEFCLDTTNNILKVGDGTNTFANLPTIGYVTEASAYSPYVDKQNPGNPGGKDATHGGIKVNGKDINVYTLNIATNSTLGGIKSGGDITVDSSTGVATVNTITSSTGIAAAGKLIRTNSNGLIDETFVMSGANLIDPTTSKIYPIKLPIATVTTDGTDGALGTIKVGDGLSIDSSNGTLSLGATTETVRTTSASGITTDTEVVSKSTEYEGYYLECTTAGTTSSDKLTIPGSYTANSTTITDNTVIWTIRYSTDTSNIMENGTEKYRKENTAYSVGDEVFVEGLQGYIPESYSSAYVLNSLSI